MSLGVRNLTDDIESIKLQPFTKVTAYARLGIKLIRLRKEEFCGWIDEWFILYQGGHAEGTIDATAQLSMKWLIGCAEEGGKATASSNSLLNRVKIGLEQC